MKTSNSPLGNKKTTSKFSIESALTNKEEEEKPQEVSHEEKLPQDHFSETDLRKEWQTFLNQLKEKDSLVYMAIQNFTLHKEGENTVRIHYSSDLAKAEFEKIKHQFFNHFQHKVNHFNIEVIYKTDVKLKKEIITKRKIFDKFAEINPILNDLNDLLNFDLT